MEVFRVTVVGQDLFKIVPEYFELAGLNPADQVNTGMLGNLKMLTYFFEIPEKDVIEKRAKFMTEMAKDTTRLMPLYVHGDWMRVFVFKPLKC